MELTPVNGALLQGSMRSRRQCRLRGYVTVPGIWYILATLCRFDDKLPQGHNQDHLFLVREGTRLWKSEKFKVVLYGPFFETGSMPGLI